jgi:nuclear cap-binding protein subunit 2
MIVVEVSLEAL